MIMEQVATTVQQRMVVSDSVPATLMALLPVSMTSIHSWRDGCVQRSRMGLSTSGKSGSTMTLE